MSLYKITRLHGHLVSGCPRFISSSMLNPGKEPDQYSMLRVCFESFFNQGQTVLGAKLLTNIQPFRHSDKQTNIRHTETESWPNTKIERNNSFI